MIQRQYAQEDVSSLTLTQVQDMIKREGIDYAADYGFEVSPNTGVSLVFSMN